MSWQDELRRLDEELATGRISADDYRARRDQIMSAAVSPGGEPAPAAPQNNESTTIMQPVKPPQDGGGDADKTQIVPGQDVNRSDHTQVVDGGWRTQAPGGPDDAGRTQVVPGVPHQAQAGARPLRPAPHPGQGGFPPPNQPQNQPHQPPNQPPWQQEEQYNEELSPPWGGQEFLPLAAAGTPDWARQGPEVFETEKKSGTGKVIGIIAIVVVLLGVAAGAYFMFRPDDNQAKPGGGGTEETSPAETTSEEPPEPEGPIAELPGEAIDMADVDTFEKVVGLNYLTQQEIAIYQAGGAADAMIGRSKDGENNVIVLVVGTADAASAVTARDALDTQQRDFGLVAREPAAPTGVLASINESASRGPLIRAHYASGNFVVRIEVQGPDLDSVNATFDELLDAQLERAPVDG